MARWISAASLWPMRGSDLGEFCARAIPMLATQQWPLVQRTALALAPTLDFPRLGKDLAPHDVPAIEEELLRVRGGLQRWNARALEQAELGAQRDQRDQLLYGSHYLAASVDAVLGHIGARKAAEAKEEDAGDLGARGGVLAADVELEPLLQHCIADVRGFSVEKHGAAPHFDLQIQADAARGLPPRLRFCVEGFIEFAVVELLKNACVAMVERFGALDVDDEDTPAIQVRATPRPQVGAMDVSVRDFGAGLPASADLGVDPFSFGASGLAAQVPGREPSYGYSREHGAAMSGHGVGLPRARVFATFHGGSLSLFGGGGGGAGGTHPAAGPGAVALLRLPYRYRWS
eukprot:g3425.t1